MEWDGCALIAKLKLCSFRSQMTVTDMTQRALINLLLLITLWSLSRCTHNTLNLPQPAQAVAGLYEAQNNQTPFPIQGKTLQLTVRQLTADSVAVKVRGFSNGRVVDSLDYRSAYIGQEFGASCVGYRVHLRSGPRSDQLNLSCNEVNVFSYLYKPATASQYWVVKFNKV